MTAPELFGDEEALYEAQPSWGAYTGWLLIAATVSLVTMGLGLPLFYVPYAKRKNTRYYITTDRVIIQKGGVGSTSTEEYQITNIDKIETSQSMMESARNKGTVKFSLRERGFDAREVKIPNIPEFQGVKEAIRRAQYESGGEDR